MKSVSAALDAHLQEEVTTLATCWRIIRTDGAAFFFTDHDRDLEFEGDRSRLTNRRPCGRWPTCWTASVANVWENRAINNWAEIGEGRWLQTSVWVDGDYPAALRLGFFVHEADDTANFGDAWSELDEGDPWRNTLDGVTLPGDGSLDLTELRRLTETALRRIAATE